MLPRLLFEAVCLQPPCRPHSSQRVHSISRSKCCIARPCCACAERKNVEAARSHLRRGSTHFFLTCSRVLGFEQFRLVSEKMHSSSKFCVRHMCAPRVAEKLRWHAGVCVGMHVPSTSAHALEAARTTSSSTLLETAWLGRPLRYGNSLPRGETR